MAETKGPAMLRYLGALSEQRDLIQTLKNNGGTAEVRALADALQRTSTEVEAAVLEQVNGAAAAL